MRTEGEDGIKAGSGSGDGSWSGSRKTESVAGSGTGNGAKRMRRELPGMDSERRWASSSPEDEEELVESALGNMLGEHGRDNGRWRGEAEGDGLSRMDCGRWTRVAMVERKEFQDPNLATIYETCICIARLCISFLALDTCRTPEPRLEIDLISRPLSSLFVPSSRPIPATCIQ